MRDTNPEATDIADTEVAMTHDLLRYAWTSYIEQADERFGGAAVSSALRKLIPL
jgi:hypothetical protein